jgi:HK97 family phage prohead protease
MQLEYKATALEEATVTPEGVISGYASRFNERDLGGDIVLPGAFTETLKKRGAKSLPMLREHNRRELIGVWHEAKEDGQGLYVKGKIAIDTQSGREALTLAQMGALSGLSIGFKTLEAIPDGQGRQLKSVNLWETSLVTFPMLESAQIDAVKAAGLSDREFEAKLTQDAQFSRSVARALMRGGLPAVRAMQDAGEAKAVHRMLESILSEIRTIGA